MFLDRLLFELSIRKYIHLSSESSYGTTFLAPNVVLPSVLFRFFSEKSLDYFGYLFIFEQC